MLQSELLSGNARLDKASNGPPAIRRRPPDDDPDAVRRIQKALVKLGFPLPGSFPNGPGSEPDGIFGPETEKAVWAFQKREFPDQPGQWDGRVGPNTLARMDALLGAPVPDLPPQPAYLLPYRVSSTSNCERATPHGEGPQVASALHLPGIKIS